MANSPKTGAQRNELLNRALDLLGPLTRFARTELSAYEAMGYLPRGELHPEEIVDTALLEALQHSEEAPRKRLYPWLRGFVRRVVRREARAARRRGNDRSLFEPIGTGRADDEGGEPRRLIDVLPDPSAPVPDRVAESEEFQRLLVDLLRQLPTDWREPFLLYVRDGASVREVAEREGISILEASRRIARARQYLRARLAEEYEDGQIPAPTEEIFALLDQVQPTPDQVARVRSRLEEAA